MSSSAEAISETRNLSQLKLQMQEILNNMHTLEASTCQEQDFHIIQQKTDALITQLENMPLELYAKQIQKCQNRRKKLKIRKKTKSKIKIVIQKQHKENTKRIDAEEATTTSHAPLQAVKKQKSHHQLRNYNNAQCFLRKFELLKMLHFKRGKNVAATRQFSAKFNQLLSIWNSVLQENQPERTQACKIEDQWNEVYFGANEKIYYGAEQKLNDFVRIRRTWDSYLTHNKKYGSSIPIGWVLPTAEASDAWQQYRSD